MPDIIKYEYDCGESESCHSGSDFWEGIIRLTEETESDDDQRKRRDGELDSDSEQSCFFEEFRFAVILL